MSSILKRLKSYEGLQRYLFKNTDYHKYGLLVDDTWYETPPVIEAVRRLPQRVKDERVYRFIRAHQLCIQRIILPENQWTKFEDNVRYLEPYIEEVQMEIKEKKEWNKNPLLAMQEYTEMLHSGKDN